MSGTDNVKTDGHTDDPQVKSGDIKASERRDTGALDFKNVVSPLERVSLAVEVEREFGQVGDFGTIDLVLAVP